MYSESIRVGTGSSKFGASLTPAVAAVWRMTTGAMRLLKDLLIRGHPIGGLACGMLLSAQVADAALVKFDYSATCATYCNLAGIAVGDPVSGTFVFDDSLLVAPTVTITNDQLVAFSFTFGATTFGMADLAPPPLGIKVINALTAPTLYGSFGVFAQSGGSGLPGLYLDTGGAGGEAYLYYASGPASTATGGSSTFASVPEPSSVVLLGLGLAGLAATRRRKQ